MPSPKSLRVSIVVFAAAVLYLAMLSRSCTAARPNILFILIDDMGWPDLGCYGHAFHETPNIDRLAAKGMRFTDFYATPVCSSTRSTIESGQNSARTGITDFLPGHWKPFAQLVVPPMPEHLDHSVRTPGDVLSAAGYVTGYFGKWHLGRGEAHAPNSYGYEVTANDLGPEFRAWRENSSEGPKRMNLLSDQAIWFLEKHANQDEPFFLHLSHHAVHIPIQANTGTIEKYVAKEKPTNGVNHPVYAAMIEDLDNQIGRLLDALVTSGKSENTIVIVTSDNGGLREVYTQNGQVISTNAPLRAEKGTIYEGGIRVPLIVKWPETVTEGSTCNTPAATWDLLPTFCEMASIDAPTQPLDGLSLTALLMDSQAQLGRQSLFFHYPHYHHSRPASAIRTGDMKLIEWFEDGAVELYDLSNDIGETVDLAATKPEMAESMREELKAWRARVGARIPKGNPDHDTSKEDRWWHRGNQAPLNLVEVGDRLEQRATPPYFRTRN